MKDAVPFAGMVMIEVAQAGLLITGKEAMASGMSNFAIVFYSYAFASLILLPSCFLFQRLAIPNLTFSLVCKFFLLGLLGCLVQVVGYSGIQYVPASFSSAMLNLIPGFTFIFAIIFRMENVDFKSPSTMAKSIGTIVTITGALIVTLYKGPQILTTPASSLSPHQHLLPQHYDYLIGGLLFTVNCAGASIFIIAQALILKKYQAQLVILFFYCFFVAIFSVIFSLVIEREPSAWSLLPKARLVATLYSVFLGSAFQIGIGMWCLHRTGPLFVAMFHPLGIVIAAVMGIIFLGDTFYLGSLVGSIVIVTGFYCVMWGKAKEDQIEEERVRCLEPTSCKAPLLQTSV